MHTDLEEPFGQQAVEDYPGTDEEREQEFLNQLQAIADSTDPKKVLIVKTSHIGGHRYSGNVVVSFLNRNSVQSSHNFIIDIHPAGIRNLVWARIFTRSSRNCENDCL